MCIPNLDMCPSSYSSTTLPPLRSNQQEKKKKHTKKEESQFSDWRQAFFESMGSEVDDETVKKVTEKRVKNKVTINPEFNNSKY